MTCIPGVIEYKGANIQLLDLPGIIEGASQGKGRGKQVIAVARTADLVVMQLDALKGPYQADQLTAELEAVGIRLNTVSKIFSKDISIEYNFQGPPDIYFKQKKGGGLAFNSTVKLTKVNQKMVQMVLADYKIFNAEVLEREKSFI